MEAPKNKKKQMSVNDTNAKLNAKAMHILLCSLNEEKKLEKLYVDKKEEKKDGVPSYANLLSSSKVDGVLALNELELQDSFNELYLEFDTINSKFKKMISKLEVENDFLLKTKLDFENQNETLKNDLEISNSSNDVL
ncbi:hypothetical protein GQ457_03G020760 [Hibiscus cannabinus]